MLKNKKHCPAIIGIYYFVDGITSPTEIGKILGVPTSSVCQILNRKFNVVGKRRAKRRTASDELLDKIEREYLDGASTYMLAEKYGVRHETIGKWMRKRGHVRGKGYIPKNNNRHSGRNKGHETIRQNAFKKCAERTLKESNGNIELIEWISMEKGRYVCHVCGTEFYRGNRLNHKAQCPTCTAVETEKRKAEREIEKELRRLERVAEYAKEKHCASCGAVFHSECKTKIYCSDTCSRRERRHRLVAAGKTKLRGNYGNHRKRARLHGVAYEPGITTEKLVERDGNVCQICGEPCDSNDLRWGYCGPLYPSIDHIVAIANGGSHTWDNVQLAHFICNSEKRDLLREELTEDVIAHAKEQVIAYKHDLIQTR